MVFQPEDLRYKSPYGAVAKGTSVHFTLRPARADAVRGGYLQARFEQRGDQIVRKPLLWRGLEGARDLFSVSLPVEDYTGLIWYSFHLDTGLDGVQIVGDYRVTVYDDALPPSDWFGRGVTYQIFPDRFARSKIPNPEGMIGARWVHENWADEPVYRPDEKGEIRNRDFFGGDFDGMIEKLPYLKELGVTTLYLNPIFEAAENHRYGTADYETVDAMLGGNEAFRRFCDAAHALDMKVMLDGVFNHTGYISRYFGGDGSYEELGAKQSEASPYRNWFNFTNWPEEYESWWGIYSLPQVNESDPMYVSYMLEGKDSIVRRWLREGADGWRLDVADELPDHFVRRLRDAVYLEKPEATVIGEVWEDGTTKIAYGVRRKHLLGRHLDGLMNYPFRNAVLGYLSGDGAERFAREMEDLRQHYPKFAFYGGMNSLGTHDTPRIITLLGVGEEAKGKDREWRAHHRMTREQYETGKRLLKLGTTIMFAFPGSPTIYYGDEIGLEGFEDPFNRRTYPWGGGDAEILEFYRKLGRARQTSEAMQAGSIRYIKAEGALLAFVRERAQEQVLCATNRSDCTQELRLPWASSMARDVLGDAEYHCDEAGELTLELQPWQAVLLRTKQ